MIKINFKFVLISIGAVVILTLALNEALARSRGGFGGFKSSRSFSSKSFGKSFFNSGAKKRTGLSSTRRKSSAGRMSSADRSLYNKAKASGTLFNSKADALKSFKGKYASKYPTRFKSKPGTRPDHIPSSVTLNGKSHNIAFRNGGYGYYAGSAWHPYSPFADPLMAASLMARGGYYYGPRPGLSFMAILGMGFTLFSLMIILKAFAASLGQGPGKFKTFK